MARLGILLAVSAIAVVFLFASPRVPLSAGYHDFADKRTLHGVPNFLNSLSNVLFLVAGVWGALWVLLKAGGRSFSHRQERLPYLVFFFGVAATGAGSFWYHLAPSNSRLPWDLLPMTLSFVSMLVAVFMERVSARVGLSIYLPLLILGAGSVAYWYFTEAQGHGDYRFYLFVQFFPPILLGLMVALFPPAYTGTGYLVCAFVFFVAAKLMESFDGQIFSWTGFISGHSLKHLTAGAACYWVLRMLQRRHPIPMTGENGLSLPSAYPKPDRESQTA
jgi:Ceramidase